MTHINQRRATAAQWTSANPVLELGEVGWETDTRKSKLGDGSTTWNSLPYTVSEVNVTKADVGLGNVDNTSDLNKPISTTTQAALDQKADATATSAAEAALRQAGANGSASNYAANGSFEYVNPDGSLVGWTRESSTGFVLDTTRHHSGTQSLRTTSGTSGIYGAGVPVSQGQVWQMDRWFTADDTAAHNGGLRLQCSSDGGTTWVAAASSSTQATVANVWQYQAVRYTVAEGVTHIRPRIAYSFTESAHVWDDDVSLTNVTALVAAQAAADTAQSGVDALNADSGRIIVGSGGSAPPYATGMSDANAAAGYQTWFQKVGKMVTVAVCVNKQATSTPIFTLPVGYRPAGAIFAALVSGSSTYVSGSGFSVNPGGSVSFYASALSNGAYYGSVTFPAAS